MVYTTIIPSILRKLSYVFHPLTKITVCSTRDMMQKKLTSKEHKIQCYPLNRSKILKSINWLRYCLLNIFLWKIQVGFFMKCRMTSQTPYWSSRYFKRFSTLFHVKFIAVFMSARPLSEFHKLINLIWCHVMTSLS